MEYTNYATTMQQYSTQTIASEYGRYYTSPKTFFANFPSLWKSVQFQVLKLETRQTYKEPTNDSYKAFAKGDFDSAIRLIETSRQNDNQLYESLQERGVDFIRCRSVIYPLSDYLKWEILSYKYNAQRGEKIYFTEDLTVFEKYAHHDFMVFDRQLAVIHNYNTDGEIKGGWVVESQTAIDSLIFIFSLIKAQSRRFEKTRAYGEDLNQAQC